MSKHSPGPWTVFNNQNSFWQIQSASVGKGYYSTIGSFCQRDKHPIHGGSISNETARANAVLASKAPEMFTLLAEALSDYGHPHFTDRHNMAGRIRALFNSIDEGCGASETENEGL